MADPGLLILITGAPGTGKTTLGQFIGQTFSIPFFSKDMVKESLFESLGWSDLEWSRRVGVASLDMLFAIAEAQLTARQSLILESNFRPEYDTRRFLDLRQRTSYTPFQIFCDAKPDTLLRRFRERWDSGQRHPGHIESEQVDSFAQTHLTGVYRPLVVGGMLHRLDTTDFADLQLDPLLTAIATALAPATGPAPTGRGDV